MNDGSEGGSGSGEAVVAGSGGDRSCAWCRTPLPAESRRDAVFCGRKCRQSAWRLRHHLSPVDDRRLPAPKEGALRFAYADPPYPGTAKLYYGDRPEYAGEVDHAELIAALTEPGKYDGWGLSTSARALRDILPLCPREARVCSWVKPHSVPPRTYGLHNVWEAVIIVQGRRLRPGRPDALVRHAARRGGDLPGRKPIAFCAWLFDALGMLPGDTIEDLFPGTGIVSAAWKEASRRGSTTDAPARSAVSERTVASGRGRR